ncbi:RagB/SusD family nutrient uptake outer membrane protein [Pedobacter frigidisoli]|uniref:RagB/SusD family nutrient uptake outer membrane protein n=1 Tax=Pedobacter frigidisoli TaxID=2530455 RepID=UPI00292EF324|nr:RagB/SusD family nutrient uptake outer membrane protein [Pedobacter frigidisoli]
MKIKNILAGFCFVISLVLFQGCEKYLAVKSDGKLLNPKTVADLQGILDDATQMNMGRTPSYGEASSDDIYLPANLIDGGSEIARNIYSWRKFEYRYPNEWSTAYIPIYNANLCIEGIENVERNGTNALAWDNVKGSALFFRSFYFFLLTSQYALGYDNATADSDMGIVLRLSSDFNTSSKRSSVRACLTQALNDARDAAALLPNEAVVKFRPSRPAAFAQLARIYLYMGDYENAMRYADECLKIKSTLMDYNGDSDVLGIDLTVPFRRYNKEDVFHAEMYAGFSLHVPNIARIDTALYASYHADDLRKRAFFRMNGVLQQFKGNYTGTNLLYSGIAVDEVLLVRAECRAKTGNVTGSMADLNSLLIKRWKNTSTYVPRSAQNQTEALQLIRSERRKELLMRGLRWSDLKRLNKDGASIRLQRVLSGTRIYLEPNAAFYALPLPVDIIELTGIPQN